MTKKISMDIPKGWDLKKIPDVAEILDNLRKPVNAKERQRRIINKPLDQLYPYYGATGQVGFIDSFLTDGEYVLIGEDGAPFFDISRSKAYMISGKTWVNNHAHILKAKDNILDNKYMMYYLNQFNYHGYVNGTTRLKLTQGSLQQIPIVLPCLDKQAIIVNKIEELFSELDNGVSNLLKTQKDLELYRKSVLMNAFQGGLTERSANSRVDKDIYQIIENSRKHFFEEEVQLKKAGKINYKPRPLKPLVEVSEEEIAQLPEIPKEWKYIYLAYLGNLSRGKSKHRPRNDKKLFGGKYPFVQTGEVKAANEEIKSYTQTYSEFGLAQSRLWPTGTLCITIAANIAETAFLGFEACFPDSIAGFTAYEGIVLPKYVYHFINSVQERIEAFAPATAQKNINLTTLENLVIPLCSLEEQQLVIDAIDEKLQAYEALKREIDHNIEKVDIIKSSILRSAFEGKLI